MGTLGGPIVLGLLVGLVARWIVPGPAQGTVADVIVGILGAAIGGWVYGFFDREGVTGFNLPSLVCAFIGAVVLLWLVRAIRGRSAT
jgi:uncharacterized membrane protein YeaQ/YmgE (transglycosylase-associated protein family)